MKGARERSALDEAWTGWVGGKTDDAVRSALALVEPDPTQLAGIGLLVRACVEGGRMSTAGEAAARLVGAYVRRGDLPRALAAAILAGRAGKDAKKLRGEIAAAFGQGSKRVQDVAPAPPPLPPREVVVSSDLAKTKGSALLDRAEAALRAFTTSEDPAPPDGPVPRLPLFGALAPGALEELLAAWELRDLPAGARAIEEGTEGRDAFVVVRGTLRAERRRGDEDVVLALLGPGAIFGEMALVSDSPRAASVVAEETSQLLAASRDALEAVAKRAPAVGQQLGEFCRARMVQNLMRHSAVLGAVAPTERAKLMARFEARSFKPGEKLVTLGAESQGLFLIASGGVRVVGRDADGDDLQVALLGPGDVVGEISLVLRRPASADVVATHPTLALELLRDRFHETIREHPTLLGELYELATKREDEMRSVVAQEALDVEEVLL